MNKIANQGLFQNVTEIIMKYALWQYEGDLRCKSMSRLNLT